MSFRKVVEDFECTECHTQVQGNGFTDHCPQCLYSRHVDIDPGDRAAMCGGLMKPVEVIFERGEAYTLVYTCLSCGYTHKNILASNDNREAIIEIMAHRSEQYLKETYFNNQ